MTLLQFYLALYFVPMLLMLVYGLIELKRQNPSIAGAAWFDALIPGFNLVILVILLLGAFKEAISSLAFTEYHKFFKD